MNTRHNYFPLKLRSLFGSWTYFFFFAVFFAAFFFAAIVKSS